MFKETKEIVALFGGSFDPPHFGHKKVIETALEELEIDKLIVIPAFLNPFKKYSYLSPKERLDLAQEMFGEFKKVVVSDYEISQNRSVKTQETLKYFQSLYIVKYFIIGADNLKNIEKWYNFRWLNSQITWVIATRGGYKLDTSKLKKFKILNVEADISSTQIRKAKGKQIQMSLNERVDRIIKVLDEKKAEELEVFNLEDVEYIAKRVVLANALSPKHSTALAQELKDKLKPQGEQFLHVDESEEWVVIDMGDILIHIMSNEVRQKYSLEELLMEIGNKEENNNE